MTSIIRLNSSGYICQNPATSWREVLGHALIVDHSRRELITLSEVAGLIWKSASNWVHTDQLVKTVQNEYDIDEETAREDTLSFVSQMLDCGLMMVAPCARGEDSGEINRPTEIPSNLHEQMPVRLKDLCRIHNIPLIAYLELTLKCNLRCIHCYNARSSQRELKKDEIKVVLDDLAKLGCLDLVITGGEPIMSPDFEEILWYARERRFCVTLKTNGTLINGKIASLLAKTFVVEVHVSLYSLNQEEHEGITRTTGSLARTLGGIECLLQDGMRVRLSCPVTKLNCYSVGAIKEFADRIGADCGFDPIITAKVDGSREPVNLRVDNEDWEKLLKNGLLGEVIYPNRFNVNDSSPTQIGVSESQSEDELVCGAGSGSVTITAGGDVLPCLTLPLRIGNVLEDRLSDIWNYEAWRPIRTLTAPQFAECIGCNLVQHCPRCPGVAFSETGKMTGAAPVLCRTASFFAMSQERMDHKRDERR